MVSKCANPGCTATFRYFHSGQLFRLESLTNHDADDEMSMKTHVPRLEFFWLCNECAGKLTLTFQKGVGVSVQPRLGHAAAAA